MADYDTGLDIVEAMLSRAGELPLNLAELQAEARRYTNIGYYAILRTFPWLYNEAFPPISILTEAKLSLTALTFTKGNALVTSAEPIPTDGAPRRLVVDRDGVPIRIASVTAAGLNITLAVPYPYTTGVGTGYLIRDEYLTPDVLVCTRIKNITTPQSKISIVGYEELDARFPTTVYGVPQLASYYTEDIIRIVRVPETAELLEFHYSKRPPKLTFTGQANDDTPVLPIDERWMISDYGLYFLLMDHGDSRAQETAQVVAGRLSEARDRQIAKMSPRIWVPGAFQLTVP